MSKTEELILLQIGTKWSEGQKHSQLWSQEIRVVEVEVWSRHFPPLASTRFSTYT